MLFVWIFLRLVFWLEDWGKTDISRHRFLTRFGGRGSKRNKQVSLESKGKEESVLSVLQDGP